jgi:hypothetical protein
MNVENSEIRATTAAATTNTRVIKIPNEPKNGIVFY